MLASIRSEARKLLSVRSTYFIVLISLVLVALFAGYGDGFRIDASGIHNPGLLASESSSAILFVGIIFSLAGLLLFGHEYRYSTIMYTLASSNSRTKSLASKFIVITGYALLVSLFIAFFSPLCTIFGAHLAGKHLVAQTFDVWSVLWRCLFSGWGYAMYAFILVAIIRSQVGSIVTFLLIPLVGENILSAIFKWIAKYLPFNSIQAIAGTDSPRTALQASTLHDVVTALVYIVGGLLVSLILFVRRDAN